MNMAQLNTPS